MPASMIQGISWCMLLLSGWLGGSWVAFADPSVAFTTDGGDAWTFEKTISAQVSGDGCDEVTMMSPVATIVARASGGRAEAIIPLAPGLNTIDARCLHDGLASGTVAQQQWLVRLRNTPKTWPHVHATEREIRLDASTGELAPVHSAPIAQYEW